MTGLLHIHIGPPKTATTSVQLALQSINISGFIYLGTRQPRNTETDEISKILYASCSTHDANLQQGLKTALDQIQEHVAAGETVVLSEEMFLYWQEDLDFFDKLERLEEILYTIPRCYIITVRNPKDALPSYYQEMYPKLTVQEKLNPAIFFNHRRCDCFDYEKLSRWFASRVIPARFVDFDSLRIGRLDLTEFLGVNAPFNLQVPMPRANQGKKGEESNLRVFQPVALSELFHGSKISRIKSRIRYIAPNVYNLVRVWANRTAIKPLRESRVVIPEDRLSYFLSSYHTALNKLIQHTDCENK